MTLNCLISAVQRNNLAKHSNHPENLISKLSMSMSIFFWTLLDFIMVFFFKKDIFVVDCKILKAKGRLYLLILHFQQFFSLFFSIDSIFLQKMDSWKFIQVLETLVAKKYTLIYTNTKIYIWPWYDCMILNH